MKVYGLKVAALVPLLAAAALAAPTGTDVERAATRTAEVLGGVLRNCPASFTSIGSAQKRCVGTSNPVEQARVQLGKALSADLYGVWRSRDGQRSVYNWLRTPGGYVYLRLQPDPEGRAQTLVYLDLPPSRTPTRTAPDNGVSPTRPAPSPAPSPRPPAAQSLAPVPFTRTLQVTTPRMNGADVRAVQNRLIALTRPSSGGQGDGWYGPVTAATVRAFQAANALPVTGRVDRATWNALFGAAARPFSAERIR
ncbi:MULTISPECIES: peptidoglycan-binding domain-containing protein [Deinococcus]|uniref:Peptidoglycan-binding domain 1 n=1 Tax=Deinococcus geothermalis (strain DSM 11300 / CIP 105573 / AG-3a) TaxID=319795 RepID=Q1IW57_DEIGD|nr:MULTISPECIES: peptidoglycan-binding domain-containing protein [Deinococcus]ABF46527.1 Peptidoglycan-binding domain 1 [Deinococcus geothermalis DSM 11300]TDE86804.1 peptidoglycan-binding protein [Deinococcus sp. S9]